MRTILIGLLALVGTSTIAQKVSIDQEKIKIPYRELAETPVAESERSFTIITNLAAGYDSYGVMQKIRVQGLTYVTGNAGINVRYDFTGIIEREREIIKIPHKEKKEGEEFIRYTYAAKIVYEYGSSYSIFDKNGAPLGNTRTLRMTSNSPSMIGCKEYVSKEFGREKDAINYLRINIDVILQEITDIILEEDARSLRVGLIGRFGYPEDTKRIEIQYLDTKKHDEYAENQKAMKATKAGLSLITSDGGTEEAREALLACEDYYKTIIGKYNEKKNDNHKKMRFMAYYNLGQIYLWTDRIGQAIDMFSCGIDNDYETRDCKKMKEFAEETLQGMQRNNINTIHFPIPIMEYFGEGETTAYNGSQNGTSAIVVDNKKITPRTEVDLDFYSETNSFEIIGYQVYYNNIYLTFVVSREILADTRCDVGYITSETTSGAEEADKGSLQFCRSYPIPKSYFEKGQYTVEINNLAGNKEYYFRPYISIDGKWSYGDILTIKTSREQTESKGL